MDIHVESQHLNFSSKKEEREAAPLPHYANSYFFLCVDEQCSRSVSLSSSTALSMSLTKYSFCYEEGTDRHDFAFFILR